MKNFIRKNITLIIFTVAGAAGGFLYWKFIGCLSGTCPIKSVWYLSTLYGSVLGYLAGSLVIELIARFRKKPAND
jgi:hypothetical protein